MGNTSQLLGWIEDHQKPYAREVPTPTKLAKRVAEPLGESPSTVQGWLDRALDSPRPLTSTEEVEHFRAVGEYMGAGHDANIAALQLAAAGHASRRLREVLRDTRESLTVELDAVENPTDALLTSLAERSDFSPVWRSWVRAASDTGTPAEHDTDVEARTAQPFDAELMASSAMLPIAQITVGEPVDDADLAGSDLHRLAGSPFAHVFDLALLSNVNAVSTAASGWLEHASDDELVSAVQHARQCVDALRTIEPTLQALGDEEYWRWVGRFTPAADFLLKLLMPMIMLLRAADAIAPTAHTRRFLAALDGNELTANQSDDP
jgi:hypothetical protein